MTILQRYVMRELLVPLGLGLVVFTFVFLVGQVFQLADLLLNHGVSALLAAELIATMLPGILSLTVPMSILVACLLGIGRLAADREILAIRTSGVNLFHVLAPVLVLAAAASGVLILANQSFVPFLNMKSSDLATQIEFNVLANIPPNRVFDLDQGGGQQSAFFYELRDPENGDMRGININTMIESEETDAEKEEVGRLRKEAAGLMSKGMDTRSSPVVAIRSRVRAIQKGATDQSVFMTARSGSITPSINERLITITLRDGSMHVTDPVDPLAYTIVRFDTLTRGIRPRFQRTEDGHWEKRAPEMSVKELRQFIAHKYRVSRMRPELYQRFSIPFACIAFALIAIPLAVYVRPTAKAIAFGMSFMLIFVYYGLLNYGVTLTKVGNPVGPYAVFFPNILLAVVGSLLLYRTVMK